MEIKTVDDLRKSYPALVDQIEQTAAKAATDAERLRIKGIEDAALPGSEELTAQAKFEKPMSVSDYAVALVKNVKDQGAAYLDTVKKDVENSGLNGVKQGTSKDKAEGDEFLAALKDLGKSREQ